VAGRTSVGLDIGTSGVRAAEVTVNRAGVTLERFGQVALPPGAVVDGEVVDVDVVARTLRQLWAASRFRSKKVVLGIANQRVIVRQIELPWMPPTELKASLPFQVHDYIPMPVDQVLLDHHPLEEVTGEDGDRQLRLLLVAAAKDMVWSAINAVRKAGLAPISVELVPFALMRSLARYDHLGLDGSDAEALVDVGARVTNVVVHAGGVPRFVRILPMGGADITDALAERLGIGLDEAEAVKQSASLDAQPDGPIDGSSAAAVVQAAGTALVDEVRSSLDYYLSQSTALQVRRIVLSGGGSRLAGLGRRLALATRLPVEDASVLSGMRVGKVGLSPEQLAYIDPLASVPVGLAIGVAA